MTGRILVTGGTGFIGRHLLPLLADDGWEVHAAIIDPPISEIQGVLWHSADLLVPGTARRLMNEVQPSHLAHLAWFVAPGRWAAAPENLDWVQTGMEWARAFLEAGGKRMIAAGSCLEYDWNYGYCSEALTPCAPHTLYGAAKNALRMILHAFLTPQGCALCWGRVFFIYGPYEHPSRLVAYVVRSLLKGEPALCSHGRQVRDYLYVEDVARAFAALARSEITGPINIAGGQPITLRSLATRIGELIGRPELIRFDAIPPAPSDLPFVVGDPARITGELGWQPAFSLDDGLMKTIDWWRHELRRTGEL